MEMSKLEDMSYKDLQKIAKSKEFKYVGVSKVDLIKSIKDVKNEEIKDLDLSVLKVDNSKSIKDVKNEEIKDLDLSVPEVDNSKLTFNGKVIIGIMIKLVNGKSYKEVQVISGERFFSF